ncbi:MAG: hypothetical protein J2P25_16395, partial [Nocardiopsaceae bacterium]|nr:hypothetical protein [Nocardiopsaceae bacterium]
MLYELADSRLGVPAPPPRHVPRPRLLAALDAAGELPLVVVSAGPGTGKTVLLAEWARRSRLPVVWLCPAPEDDEPARFGALVASALRAAAGPGAPHLVPPQAASSEAGSSQAGLIDFAHWLLGQVPDGQVPLILAIDDAHVLTGPRVTGLLDALVRHGGSRLHVVLAARRDPPLPLHRYRLAGLVREVRMADLALTPGETREVLAAHGVALPAPAMKALAARTEGWVAGVRLAAMRMERAADPAGLVRELSFDYGSVGEYLMAEVVDRQPEPLRRILVETSFLDEVTGPLAEAVTGLDGAGEMLAELAAGDSLVIRLDPASTRFRYHRLLAEVLRYLLARDRKHEMPELAARAAACFEREGDLEQAMYWAARAGDRERAARVLVRGGLADAFARGRDIPVAELTGVLPPGSVLLAQASARFWHGAHDDVEELLDQALAAARRDGPAGLEADVLGMIACVASYRGRPRHA